MIEIRNLTKSYPNRNGRRYVFKNLNLKLPDGAGIGLIGRNGAGKTTLLRILGGIEAPDSGEVITTQSISWPIGLAGGFQTALSARENVRFVCRVFGARGEEMREKVAWVENFADIGEYFDLPMRTYSPGMRSRVTFGCSMAFDFDYYLIDEVMAVGDPIFRGNAARIFREKLEKAGAILVSNNHKDIQDMCSAVIFIRDGEAKVYEDVEAGLAAFKEMAEALRK